MKCGAASHGMHCRGKESNVANRARERKAERMRTRGWFDLPERPGDRTLEQQLRGLEPLFAEVKGKSILDIGCAEGLISLEAARLGARKVLGAEIVPGHIKIGNRLAAERGFSDCTFIQADADQYRPQEHYDIVLLLALLHKLQDPIFAASHFASICDDLCVMRLSPSGRDVIVDARTNNRPFDIGAVMEEAGFVVERKELGPFDEVVWYYRRKGGANGSR